METKKFRLFCMFLLLFLIIRSINGADSETSREIAYDPSLQILTLQLMALRFMLDEISINDSDPEGMKEISGASKTVNDSYAEEMGKILGASKTINDSYPGRTFEYSTDLQNFIIDTMNTTFMTNCSAYEQYIKEMLELSTAMIPEGSNHETKAANLTENTSKAEMMSDERFKNIFKFSQFMFEASCKNSELFKELKTKTKKAERGKQVHINNVSGGVMYTKK